MKNKRSVAFESPESPVAFEQQKPSRIPVAFKQQKAPKALEEIKLSKSQFVMLLKECMYSSLGLAKRRVEQVIGSDCQWCDKNFIETVNACTQRYADDLFIKESLVGFKQPKALENPVAFEQSKTSEIAVPKEKKM